MSESLANGAALTPETYADFVARLKHWNDGEGVNDHYTSDPVFMVEKLVHVFGIDRDYTDEYAICDHEGERYWTSVDEFVAEHVADYPDFMQKLDAAARAERMDETATFNACSDSEKLNAIGQLDWLTVYGYAQRWDVIGVHLTREAAQAFIKRKGHDYDDLRIMVESSVYGWEFNTIIRAMIDGRLVLKGEV